MAVPSAKMAERSDEFLADALPVQLGSSGFGHVSTVATPEFARELLHSEDQDLRGALLRELLAAKVNIRRAEKHGEPLGSAMVASSRVVVNELVAQADALVAEDPLYESKANVVLHTLQAVNRGGVTYLSPRRLWAGSADSDSDRFADRVDNCPMVANANQADRNGDGIGDACEPAPRVWCVERRGAGSIAVFGYDSPLKDYWVRHGTENQLSEEAGAARPPVLFKRGGEKHAVVVPFEGDSVTWTVMTRSATATHEAPRCDEIEAGALTCEAQSSEFHCCTSIRDCRAAERFGVYAGELLQLGERARIVGEDGAPAAALSLGSVRLEADAHVGELLSGGELILGKRAAVSGGAVVKGGITVLGTGQPPPRLRKTPVDAPSLDGLLGPYLGGPAAGVVIHESESAELSPGAYGTLIVEGDLALPSGEYHFTALEVREGGRLFVRADSGPVVVHIASSLSVSGRVMARPGELLFELHGSGSAVLVTSIAATLLGPQSSVVLGPGVLMQGSIYAKRVELGSDATVARSHPLRPR